MCAFRRMRSIFLGLLSIICLVTTAQAQTPPPADQVFSLSASRGDEGQLELQWTVAPGNYLYRDSLQATLDGQNIAIAMPNGEAKDDPNFGRVEIYHGSIKGRLDRAPASGTLQVSYQGCGEQGICYPKVAKTVDLSTLAISAVKLGLGGLDTGEQPTVAQSSPAQADQPSAPEAPAVAEPEADTAASYLAGNPLMMAVAFLGFGLLLAFTPCVFPVIPILSAMLAGAGQSLSMGRSFVLSTSYVLAMATAYGIVGLVAGWSGANLQTALQTPVALFLAAAVFVALAFSMFGFYEIGLPAGLSARMSSGSTRGGSILGAGLLGLGSALIVAPCVTPPLAAAMLFAVQSGKAMKGGAALFFLGLGMGLPLIAFGTFGGRILPRSGPWMVRVRQVFGAVFLAVAAMLVARLLSPPAALALWGVVALGIGAFVGGFDNLDGASGWRNRLGKASGLVAALYGATLIVGAAGGAADPLRPLSFLSGDGAVQTQALGATTTDSPAAFDAAVAANAGKPILISFKADWCTVCKSNEAIMGQPPVLKRLQAMPVIDVDVTKQDENSRVLMSRFSVVGPPTMFLLDAEGREIPASRMIGPISADDITRRLSQAGG